MKVDRALNDRRQLTNFASFLPVTETLPPFHGSMGLHNEGILMSPISSDYEKQSRYLHGIYFRKYFEKTILNENWERCFVFESY